MTVTFDLPQNIERSLREELGNLEQAVKEAALVELYRQRKLTHHELAQALSISRFETDALLKKHGVTYDMSFEDVMNESDSIRPAGKQ